MSRPLTLFDRTVKVPLGLLWLAVVMLVAVPVMLYMTGLYYLAAATHSIRAGVRSMIRKTREEET